MRAHSTRQRRRRRTLVTAALVALTMSLATVAVFWARAERDRQVAVEETRRREAAQLLALGRARLAEEPTEALAFALASLEAADNRPARHFAVEALWQGPPVFRFAQDQDPWNVDFSSDGRWAVVSGSRGIFLWLRHGGPPRQIAEPEGRNMLGYFDAADRVVWFTWGRPTVSLWKPPEGPLVRTFELPDGGRWPGPGDIVTVSPLAPESPTHELRRFSFETGEAEMLGQFEFKEGNRWLVYVAGKRLLRFRGDTVTAHPWGALDEPPRLVGRAPDGGDVWFLYPQHDGPPWVGTGVRDGEVRLWPMPAFPSSRPQVLQGVPEPPEDGSPGQGLAVDPTGRFVAMARIDDHLLWDLAGPPDAKPLELRSVTTSLETIGASFSQDGRWLAVTRRSHVDLWPMGLRRSYVLPVPGKITPAFDVTRDSRFVVSVSWGESGEIKAWPLHQEDGAGMRVIYQHPRLRQSDLRIDPTGRLIAASHGEDGRVAVVPLDGGAPRLLEGPGWTHTQAFNRTGQRLATQFLDSDAQTAIVRVWDLESGETWDLNARVEGEECLPEGSFSWTYVWWMEFLPDGSLVTDTLSGLRVWDVESGKSRRIRAYGADECYPRQYALSPDGRLLAMSDVDLSREQEGTGRLAVRNLGSGAEREIRTHGTRTGRPAFDPSGQFLATAGGDGVVRVGPVTGEEPHLFYGHTKRVWQVGFSPDGRWVLSLAEDRTLRVWPMPQGPPLHTLPYEALLSKLRSMTNLRVVPDPHSPSGYEVEAGPFPGWAKPPEW